MRRFPSRDRVAARSCEPHPHAQTPRFQDCDAEYKAMPEIAIKLSNMSPGFWRRVLLTQACCLGFSWAPHASAGSATCLWHGLPHALRNRVIAVYATGGADTLGSVNVTDELIRQITRSCIGRDPTDDQVRAAGAALVGEALAESAAAELSARYRLTPAKLNITWANLISRDRSILLKQFIGSEPSLRDDAELYVVVRKAAASLGWKGAAGSWNPNDGGFKVLADFIGGRAQAEFFAGQF